MKYSHNKSLSSETCKSSGPWGGYTAFYQQPFAGNSSTKYGFRRMFAYQKMVTANSYYSQLLSPLFTTDETLICRAEAYALLGRYDEAVKDIAAWQNSYTSSSKTLTLDDINNFYGPLSYWSVKNMTLKKQLNPQFTIREGAENLIHNILHIRRLLNLGNGLRWQDVKRYGITNYRLSFYGNTITEEDVMYYDDERQAVQIPSSVIAAGMQPNPR